jgi:hypothetical protein
MAIHEADHFKAERRKPGDVDAKTSLDRLFAVLEREPTGQVIPDDPVDVPSKTAVGSSLPAFTQTPPSPPTNGWSKRKCLSFSKLCPTFTRPLVSPQLKRIEIGRLPFDGR